MIKLLYIEDEADIREIVALALEDEGFDITFCDSGEQALEEATDFHPDVILLDVMMPGMDGPTTLQHLRKLPALKSTPIIFLTARVQPEEIDEFMDLGATDIISKPFDPMTLAEQIHSIMKRVG